MYVCTHPCTTLRLYPIGGYGYSLAYDMLLRAYTLMHDATVRSPTSVAANRQYYSRTLLISVMALLLELMKSHVMYDVCRDVHESEDGTKK